MMPDIAKSLLEFLKLAPRYLLAIIVVCGTFLFAPPNFQLTLGITNFVESYRQWIGFIFVCSFGLWIVVVAVSVSEVVKNFWRKRARQKNIANRLEDLTESEKQILRYYFAKNTRSNKLRIENGNVQALANAGIIFHSAALGSVIEGFAHNITDFAWDYIHQNPHVLDGMTNTYHTDERSW